MVPLSELSTVVNNTLSEWSRLRWSDLHFADARGAQLALALLLGLAVLGVVWRTVLAGSARRGRVALPAVLPGMHRSWLTATRHGALLLFLLGLPLFALALADPKTTLVREETTAPGRRIALLVDGSTSMVMKFDTTKIKTQATGRSAGFYTAVASAEYFMRMRMNGRYRDLVALVQFGNEAYVVTPFTTDYENILLSVRLIGDPKEWGRFTDSGTTIMRGIEQTVELFQTFDFLNASGNLMVIFSDGRDTQSELKGRSLDDVMIGARKAKIPVYMIRTAYNFKLGGIPDDAIWKPAVEKTGGRFFAAANEDSILEALDEINKLSPGKIEVRTYTTERPRFSAYALGAAGLWFLAALLKLGLSWFTTFP